MVAPDEIALRCFACRDEIGDVFVVLHARKTGFVALLSIIFCSEACFQSLLEGWRRWALEHEYGIEEIVVRRVAYSCADRSLTERIQRLDSLDSITRFPNILYGYFPAQREPLSPTEAHDALARWDRRLSKAPGAEDFQANLFVWRRTSGFWRRIECI